VTAARVAALAVLAAVALGVSVRGAYSAFVATTSSSGNSLTAAPSFAACDYRATVLATSGVVGYWRLGETSGTTATDSAGTNHGTYTNGVTLGAADAIAGDPNTAATFDGTNDYVNVPDSAALKPATQVSVEAWVKPNAGIPNYRSVATKTSTNSWNNGYGMYAWSGGIDFWVNDDANDVLTIALPTGSWSHVVGTFNGTSVRIYLNGVLAQTFNYTASLSHAVTPLRIGDAAGTSNYHWPGGLDDVAVYNTALNATTIHDHFRCGQRYRDVILDTSGLLSYWRLGEPLGSVAFDSKGTVTGTYTNGVTLSAAGALTVAGDTAASFDGTNDYVSLGDPASLKVANPSLEAWVKTTDTDGIVFRARWYGIWLRVAGGKAQFGFNDAAATTHNATSAASVNDNAWHHLAGTYDGATVRLYVDGVQAGSLATTATVYYGGGGMAIGRDGDADATYLAGTIDEPAVYNRALTAAEVKQHFDAR
jgi:hypothetical protein